MNKTFIVVIETDGIVPINTWVYPNTSQGMVQSRKKFNTILKMMDKDSVEKVDLDTARDENGCLFLVFSDPISLRPH